MHPATTSRSSPAATGPTAAFLLAAVLLAPGPPPLASEPADWLRGEELAPARRALERSDLESARFALVTLAARSGDSLRAHYALVFTRLRLGELDLALDAAEKAVAAHPAKGYAHAALGMARVHLVDFDGAESAFAEAVRVGPGVAAAHLGLGELRRAQRREIAARSAFETAYRLDPHDPRILEAVAEATADRTRRLELLAASVEHSLGLEPGERDMLAEQLDALRRMGEGGGCRLRSLTGALEIRTEPLRTRPRDAPRPGLRISANDARPIVALLDSAASGVILAESYARKAVVARLAPSQLRGIGTEGARRGYLGRVERLGLGRLVFEDCLVTVLPGRYLTAAKAIVGLEPLATPFRLTFDFPRNRVRLEPYPALSKDGALDSTALDPHADDGDPGALGEGSVPVLVFGEDVLVPATLDGNDTHLLLDTGASRTVLSSRLARTLGRVGRGGARVAGISGRVEDVETTGTVELRIGGRLERATSLPAVDLDQHAATTGFGVGGFLGYDVLQRRRLVLDLRNGLVRFE